MLRLTKADRARGSTRKAVGITELRETFPRVYLTALNWQGKNNRLIETLNEQAAKDVGALRDWFEAPPPDASPERIQYYLLPLDLGLGMFRMMVRPWIAERRAPDASALEEGKRLFTQAFDWWAKNSFIFSPKVSRQDEKLFRWNCHGVLTLLESFLAVDPNLPLMLRHCQNSRCPARFFLRRKRGPSYANYCSDRCYSLGRTKPK